MQVRPAPKTSKQDNITNAELKVSTTIAVYKKKQTYLKPP